MQPVIVVEPQQARQNHAVQAMRQSSFGGIPELTAWVEKQLHHFLIVHSSKVNILGSITAAYM